jgi:catechol 2,3-dioxygenase-like lactoylglutathione lyase family enzyme
MRLHSVVLGVRDIEASLVFYTDVPDCAPA